MITASKIIDYFLFLEAIERASRAVDVSESTLLDLHELWWVSMAADSSWDGWVGRDRFESLIYPEQKRPGCDRWRRMIDAADAIGWKLEQRTTPSGGIELRPAPEATTLDLEERQLRIRRTILAA